LPHKSLELSFHASGS